MVRDVAYILVQYSLYFRTWIFIITHSISGLLECVLRLVFQTEHDFSGTGSVPVMRCKEGRHLLCWV